MRIKCIHGRRTQTQAHWTTLITIVHNCKPTVQSLAFLELRFKQIVSLCRECYSRYYCSIALVWCFVVANWHSLFCIVRQFDSGSIESEVHANEHAAWVRIMFIRNESIVSSCFTSCWLFVHTPFPCEFQHWLWWTMKVQILHELNYMPIRVRCIWIQFHELLCLVS